MSGRWDNLLHESDKKGGTQRKRQPNNHRNQKAPHRWSSLESSNKEVRKPLVLRQRITNRHKDRVKLVDNLKAVLFQPFSREEQESKLVEILSEIRREHQTILRSDPKRVLHDSNEFVSLLFDVLELDKTSFTDSIGTCNNLQSPQWWALQCLESYLQCLLASMPKHPQPVQNFQERISKLSLWWMEMTDPIESSSEEFPNVLVTCIARFVTAHVPWLTPEWTAQNVVGRVFLPYFSFSVSSSHPSSKEAMLAVCQSLTSLLETPNHSSGILAPLVQEVSISPNYDIVLEEQTINPLKEKLLFALLKSLTVTPDHSVQAALCTSLSASLHAIRKLNKGQQSSISQKNDVQLLLTPLQNFLVPVFSKGLRLKPSDVRVLPKACLELMRAVILCYPRDVTSLGWKLLIEASPNNPILSSFLRHEHENCDNTEYLGLLLDSIAGWIGVLPWSLWLTKGRPSRIATSGLHKSVVQALCSLMKVVRAIVTRCCRASLWNGGLGKLLKGLFLEIPYDQDPKLMEDGVHLWDSLMQATRKQKTSLQHDEVQDAAADVMMGCTGGTITPQGHLLGMCAPSKDWFQGDKESTSVDEWIFSFRSQENSKQQERDIRVLASVVRSLPEVVLRRWDCSFRKMFQELNTSPKTTSDRLRLDVLESFMLGRKDYEIPSDLQTINEEVVSDIDDLLLQRWNPASIKYCLSIYSALGKDDWRKVNAVEGRIRLHFNVIMMHCQSPSAKCRECAAKAAGDFCTHFIMPKQTSVVEDEKLKQCRWICNQITVTMIKLCQDSNAGARSMALFCLGNLAYALRESSYDHVLDLSTLQEIASIVLSTCNVDTNGKVVKNAIRSIGHVGNLLAWSLRSQHEEITNDLALSSPSCRLLVDTIRSLSQTLSKTLHVALNDEQKASMTWKERSAAKKNGWGACYSLGLLFEGISLPLIEGCDTLMSACADAIKVLLQCPCHSSNLTEKIVLAAMAAVGKLSGELLGLVDATKGYRGEALLTAILLLEESYGAKNNCIHHNLFSPNVASSKLTRQNQDFLCHLLVSEPSIKDAMRAVTDERVTKSTLDALYSWMVEDSRRATLPGQAFEIFAIALQDSSVAARVGLEQQFTSRALQQHKLQTIGPGFSTDGSWSSIPSTHDDEADEL